MTLNAGAKKAQSLIAAIVHCLVSVFVVLQGCDGCWKEAILEPGGHCFKTLAD